MVSRSGVCLSVRQVAFEEKNDWVYLLAVKENDI